MDDAVAQLEAPPSRSSSQSSSARRTGSSKSKNLSAPTRFGHFYLQPHVSEAYDSLTSPAAHAKRAFIWFDKRQPTSAIRSAELVWQLGHCSYPPLRLLLGHYAVESVRDRLRCVIEEIEDWRWLNFPGEGGEEGSRGRTKIEMDDDSGREDGDDYGDAEMEGE